MIESNIILSIIIKFKEVYLQRFEINLEMDNIKISSRVKVKRPPHWRDILRELNGYIGLLFFS